MACQRERMLGPSGVDDMTSATALEHSTMLLTLSPILHQLGPEVNVFVGEGSIKKSLLCGKTVANSTVRVTGRTMLRHAKDVLCNCKKMMAIVTWPNSPYKDGNFPSGTNWEDCMRWCLISINKDILADATTACIAVDAAETSFESNAGAVDDEVQSPVLAVNDDNNQTTTARASSFSMDNGDNGIDDDAVYLSK